MDLMTRKAMRLASRPLWAMRSEAFLALMTAIKTRTFFQAEAFSSLKPRTLGKDGKVMLLPITGILTKDDDWAGTTYNAIHDALEKAADPSVKRLVLQVDSPGGDVIGLPEAASALADFAKTKPLSAIVEGQSASAAYWLTSQAHDITIAPSAEVGSVGVRMMHMDISKSLADSGVKVTELYAGDYKTEWSQFHALTKAAKEDMQGRLDTVHRQFISDISSGRGYRAKSAIRAARFGEGRMFDAQTALGHGLVDRVQAPRDFYKSIVSSEPNGSADYGLRRARLELERTRF